MAKVAVQRCFGYDLVRVERQIKLCLQDLGGGEQFISPGMLVILKPNILTGSLPEDAVCTHPALVAAVIDITRELGAEPVVAESPGSGSLKDAAGQSQITDICLQKGVRLIDIGTYPKMEVELPSGTVVMSRLLSEADLVINLPKLKTHQLTYLTGAVKNLYGYVPGRLKTKYHLRFPSREALSGLLVDIYDFIRPGLTIMDGVVAMDGEGPRSGTPRKMGVVIAGSDGVAVDAVAASLTHLTPFAVPTTRIAHQRGIGTGNLDDITVVGEALDSILVPHFEHVFALKHLHTPVQSRLVGLWRKHFAPYPTVERKDCTGCRNCLKACPAKAITFKQKGPVINRSKCIMCYCCHEFCPHGAIKLKSGLLGGLFR